MDNTAIKEIADLAVAAKRAQILAYDTPAALVGERIISLEHLYAQRARYRGKFETSIISDFCAYVTANAGGVGFVDAVTCSAKVFFNLGTIEAPGHGDYTATLKAQQTAAYQAILGVNGKRFTQRELVEFIEDWIQNFTGGSTGEDQITMKAAIAAIRKVKITTTAEQTTTDRDMGASRSTLENIEASSDTAIPTYLIFNCAPYFGLQARSIGLRLSIITGEKPAIGLRIIALEAMNENILQEFKQVLTQGIGTAANLTIGSFTP